MDGCSPVLSCTARVARGGGGVGVDGCGLKSCPFANRNARRPSRGNLGRQRVRCRRIRYARAGRAGGELNSLRVCVCVCVCVRAWSLCVCVRTRSLSAHTRRRRGGSCCSTSGSSRRRARRSRRRWHSRSSASCARTGAPPPPRKTPRRPRERLLAAAAAALSSPSLPQSIPSARATRTPIFKRNRPRRLSSSLSPSSQGARWVVVRRCGR